MSIREGTHLILRAARSSCCRPCLVPSLKGPAGRARTLANRPVSNSLRGPVARVRPNPSTARQPCRACPAARARLNPSMANNGPRGDLPLVRTLTLTGPAQPGWTCRSRAYPKQNTAHAQPARTCRSRAPRTLNTARSAPLVHTCRALARPPQQEGLGLGLARPTARPRAKTGLVAACRTSCQPADVLLTSCMLLRGIYISNPQCPTM